MGTCASTPDRRLPSGIKPGEKPDQDQVLSSIKVIDMDGNVTKFNPPICVDQILLSNQDCFLCDVESMAIDAFPTRLPESEELEPGHLYFLLPKCKSEKPMSLDDLCELAIKASSNLTIQEFQSSFRHYSF